VVARDPVPSVLTVRTGYSGRGMRGVRRLVLSGLLASTLEHSRDRFQITTLTHATRIAETLQRRLRYALYGSIEQRR
jgi:hypothetical protein